MDLTKYWNEMAAILKEELGRDPTSKELDDKWFEIISSIIYEQSEEDNGNNHNK